MQSLIFLVWPKLWFGNIWCQSRGITSIPSDRSDVSDPLGNPDIEVDPDNQVLNGPRTHAKLRDYLSG